MLRAKQLSPHATATEAMPLRACALQQEKAPWQEARTPQLESSPRSLQLEQAPLQQQRASKVKTKLINFEKSKFFFKKEWSNTLLICSVTSVFAKFLSDLGSCDRPAVPDSALYPST